MTPLSAAKAMNPPEAAPTPMVMIRALRNQTSASSPMMSPKYSIGFPRIALNSMSWLTTNQATAPLRTSPPVIHR